MDMMIYMLGAKITTAIDNDNPSFAVTCFYNKEDAEKLLQKTSVLEQYRWQDGSGWIWKSIFPFPVVKDSGFHVFSPDMLRYKKVARPKPKACIVNVNENCPKKDLLYALICKDTGEVGRLLETYEIVRVSTSEYLANGFLKNKFKGKAPQVVPLWVYQNYDEWLVKGSIGKNTTLTAKCPKECKDVRST